jgi:hypothetical protein
MSRRQNPQVIVHEGDEPDAVNGLPYADPLAGEDLADIDLASAVEVGCRVEEVNLSASIGQKEYARQCLTDSSGRAASGVSTSRIEAGRVATA